MSDQSDFLRLYMSHLSEIRTFVRALVSSRQDCDDVCQEIAVVLWKKFDQYDPGRPFGAWARGIAVKEVQSFRGKSSRQPIPFSLETICAIRDEFDRRQPRSSSRLMDIVQRCIGRLTERARRLLSLRYERELTVCEIAARDKLTEAAIYKALARSRDSVRRCVQRTLAAEESKTS